MRYIHKTYSWVFASCALVFTSVNTNAQTVAPGYQFDGKSANMIYTSLPFLLISPDAKAGGLGETGVATSNDANALYWNPAKLSFLPDSASIAVSYTPWLRKLVNDISLSYLALNFKLKNKDAVGLSLKHFSIGQIYITDGNGIAQGTYKPVEFSIDGAYSKRLSDEFALGIAFRFIHSSINTGATLDVISHSRPISTASADVSAFYKKETYLFGKDAEVALGFNISNLGNQVTYQVGNVKYFIPTNLRLGGATTFYTNRDRFTFSMDFNKLMVPTSPERNADGDVIRGRETDGALFSSLFGSFSDAPGGFREELKEISMGIGAEYWMQDQFALRAGYFYEDRTKGNRKYLTAGFGVNYKNSLRLDMSYIIANRNVTPLAQTLRISLNYVLKPTKEKSPDDIMKGSTLFDLKRISNSRNSNEANGGEMKLKKIKKNKSKNNTEVKQENKDLPKLPLIKNIGGEDKK